MIVWDERNDVVQADGEPGPRGLAIQALVTAMRVVAPELMASEPAFDPVDVLYSQASFRTRWMLDQRGRGAAWSNRDAAREYEDNAWRASRQQVLQRLSEIGIQPRLLSSAMVEAGALRHDGSRALILPHAIALSQAEADEIRAFARRGGTVLADTEPGLFDQHSRRLPAPLLAGIAALPDAMMLDAGETSSETLAAFGALLRNAGVPPRADLRGPDGQTANGIDAVWLRHGDTTILALQAVAPWGAPARIEVRLPLPAMVEDMRIPGRSLRAERIVVDLDPIDAHHPAPWTLIGRREHPLPKPNFSTPPSLHYRTRHGSCVNSASESAGARTGVSLAMRILFHHRIASRDGQAVHIEELIAALRRQGHETILVGPPSFMSTGFGGSNPLVDRIKRSFPGALYELSEIGYNAKAFLRLRAAVRAHRPDIIYERFSLFLLAGLWMHRLSGIPMLLEVNSPLYEERTKNDGLRLRHLGRWAQRLLWNHVDHILPVTRRDGPHRDRLRGAPVVHHRHPEWDRPGAIPRQY